MQCIQESAMIHDLLLMEIRSVMSNNVIRRTADRRLSNQTMSSDSTIRTGTQHQRWRNATYAMALQYLYNKQQYSCAIRSGKEDESRSRDDYSRGEQSRSLMMT